MPPAAQITHDLATRLGVSEDQIAIQGLRFVAWETESLHCPPSPDSTLSLEYVMIVTEDGVRYELPTGGLKQDKYSAMLAVLSVDEDFYSYYVIGDQFLFCPNEQ